MTAPDIELDLFGGVSAVEPALPTVVPEEPPPELLAGPPADMQQAALFDLAGITEAAPDAAVRAAMVAQGDTAAGRKRIFEAATIRQITLAYGWEEHQRVVQRLQRVLTATGCKNPSEALLKLLDVWEARGLRG